jgi:ATP phosphoribosyltransferase regulatory subunit
VAAELAPSFVVDLGETREFYYYTGTMFHLLAEGPGEPLGSGGRYDDLLDRFGLSCPAAGFAFDVANVCWALDQHGSGGEPPLRVLVSVASGEPRFGDASDLVRSLRERGVACALGPEPDAARAYSARWDYTHVLWLTAASVRLERIDSGIASDVPYKDAKQLAEVVATRLGVVED